MTWVLVAAGSGLLLGLTLLVWVLKERSKRHAAEEKATKLESEVAILQGANANQAALINQRDKELGRQAKQLLTLRNTISKLREQLVECRDPEAIKQWLEDELKEQI